MSTTTAMQKEIADLQSDLKRIDFAKHEQALAAATERMKVAGALLREYNLDKNKIGFATDAQRDVNRADADLRRVQNDFDVAERDSRRARQRIDEIERTLNAGTRIDEAHKQLAAQRDTESSQQHALDLIDAAIARLEAMQGSAQARLAEFADTCAEQLLIDAGLPGEVTAQPKNSEIFKTEQELATIIRALAKAGTTRSEHLVLMHATERETREIQTRLLEATADKMRLDHAEALGLYLPTLAALRRAEFAAHGCQISPSVDVETLARAMREAANE